jgi:uncharacterized surface protein with fasciclin (FAS1) repeats/uncharacterized membrane protein YuzA (DUF378 family)
MPYSVLDLQRRKDVMKNLDVIIAVLLVVGGLNWGLVGLFHFDLVATLLGSFTALSRIVYGLVGLAAIYQLVNWRGMRRRWATARSMGQAVALVVAGTALLALSAVHPAVAAGTTPAMSQETKMHATAGNGPATKAKTADIVKTATAAGSFKTLVAAIRAAGLTKTLEGKGPFTVFAPTDEAFAKLPKGTVENLLKPENKDKLTAILTYHVIPGAVSSAEVVKLTSAKTVQGQSLSVVVAEGKVTVDGANVIQTDIAASNGVIHVIDTVLMPKSM